MPHDSAAGARRRGALQRRSTQAHALKKNKNMQERGGVGRGVCVCVCVWREKARARACVCVAACACVSKREIKSRATKKARALIARRHHHRHHHHHHHHHNRRAAGRASMQPGRGSGSRARGGRRKLKEKPKRAALLGDWVFPPKCGRCAMKRGRKDIQGTLGRWGLSAWKQQRAGIGRGRSWRSWW